MTTNTISASVAEEVRAVMARRRLSQVKLGKAMGMSQPAINRRVRGLTPFSVEELTVIAAILDVPLSTFLPTTSAA